MEVYPYGARFFQDEEAAAAPGTDPNDIYLIDEPGIAEVPPVDPFADMPDYMVDPYNLPPDVQQMLNDYYGNEGPFTELIEGLKRIFAGHQSFEASVRERAEKLARQYIDSGEHAALQELERMGRELPPVSNTQNDSNHNL